MSNRLIARRYARALAGVAGDLDGLVRIRKDLAAVVSAVRVNADLRRLVLYPLLTPEQKISALDAVLAASGASTIIRRFFSVLTRATRLNLIYDLSSAFDEIVDERMGVVEAIVRTSQVMSESQFETLTEVLSTITGKKVRINWQQDFSIIGGIKVQIGSTVYDASIKGQLSLIKAKLVLV